MAGDLDSNSVCVNMERKDNQSIKLNNDIIENSANPNQAMVLTHRQDIPKASANLPNDSSPGSFVKVPKMDLENLVAEVMQLKSFLPKIVADDQRCLNHFPSGNVTGNNYQQLFQDLKTEYENLRFKHEQLEDEVKVQKQETDRLQGTLTQMNEELSQQLEYCANMGASMGTMLWKLSKDEQCVQSMLVGVRTEEFLRLVAQTIDSFIATYSDKSVAMPSEISDESEYILSLCGIVTNMAATPDGRDYLISSECGREVFEAFFTVLCAAPNNKLRLLQSLALEPDSPEFTKKLQATIPLSLIHNFIDDSSSEVKMAANELLSDITAIYHK
ncbi:uncharacterized protein TRIADDRAFT_55117 [Trichoplax adhaerens]|uniref:Heat shock factor 2-binding protein n=1 Tax=Trichoplax adhaerens TaxID=10228 RepID=B3RU09_TRIAD|nr:hypothetical protein TRIADDRAFT_55117 [Trichoplax adhaerens]EDV25720.1 hypothetical protein TRIADDRAFT_55117 [Trichoplax adhaerens]|eukprot:XP_002111753.1 hypothetical protein TRIADDRAFT_55117 [Trichoplax adhaerens]